MTEKHRVLLAIAHRLSAVGLALVLSGCATITTLPATGTATQRIERFRACPAVISPSFTDRRENNQRVMELMPEVVPDEVLTAPDAWAPVASAQDKHIALRRRAGVPMPVGPRQILVFTHSEHWTSVEKSLVATRGGDRIWRVDFVSQINVGTDAPHETTVERHALSPEQSRALDASLADPCLGAEPTNTTWTPSVWSSDQPRWTIEFRGVAGDRRIAGEQTGFGRVGRILSQMARRAATAP